MAKIGRNAPCPCGSGKKYKKCHGGLVARPASVLTPEEMKKRIASLTRRNRADEAVRVQQQGHGRPIISTKFGKHIVVASGNTVHFSESWKTFTDFLSDYVKSTLGRDWGNAEIAKPLEKRHPILQWYDALFHLQAANQTKEGEVFSTEMTGVVFCYMGLAYNLYLIKHNVELQSRLVARLKDVRQFQGAYYELIVANCLIRAGFEIELENETDQASKHCEFSARSKRTGKRYWVEAKMRGVPNLLGKTAQDGSKSSDPTSRLSAHLGDALRKPADDERMVFIDINANPNDGGGEPAWLEQAIRRLDDRERNLEEGQQAYVFVTNLAFHRRLEETRVTRELLAHGLGMADFGKPGEIRLSDWYRNKQKHIDAFEVIEAVRNYPQLPSTFDGQPASEAYYGSHNRRLRVGETYFFEDAVEGGLTGEVTSVAVMDTEKSAYVAVAATDGRSMILKCELTEAEFEDYRIYGHAYFGDPDNHSRETNDISEFYEWLVDIHSKTPRKLLLEQAKDHPEFERLKELDDTDLVLTVCEFWAAALQAQSLNK